MSALPFSLPSANDGHLLRLPMRQVTIYSILCLTLLVSHATYAAERYWVSVGSFASENNASRLLTTLTERLAITTQLQSLEKSEEHRIYRVVVGPFDHKPDAVEKRVQLQIDYPGAWVWTERLDSLSASQVDMSKELNSDSMETVPEIPLESSVLHSEVSSDWSEEKQLIEEAPPGYGLHKLRRNE